MLPPCLLWIDPGDMTGLARLETAASCPPFRAEELPYQAAGTRIENLCRYYGNRLAVGWERYTIDMRRPQTNAHDAIGMIGITRFFAHRHGCRVLQPQMPNDRNVATPAMCKALGWWLPGKKDAQSATQHLLAYLLRTGQLPPAESGILSKERHKIQET